MFKRLIQKVVGTKNERELKRLQPRVAAINVLEDEVRALNAGELRARTAALRQQAAAALARGGNGNGEPDDAAQKGQVGEALDPILPQAVALCREAGRRILGMRHLDVGLIGGMVLHEGKIAEMATGEGKTLVATLPAYLNALTGRGVHVVTVNDYLARRDAEWMGRVHRF